MTSLEHMYSLLILDILKKGATYLSAMASGLTNLLHPTSLSVAIRYLTPAIFEITERGCEFLDYRQVPKLSTLNVALAKRVRTY